MEQSASPSPPELTTVGPDFAVVHEGTETSRYEELEPDTAYELGGFSFRTLPARGELLCRFATVNDVHFGEVECGVLDGIDLGPVFRTPPGEDPYPEVMNRGAVEEIQAITPMAVAAKGDLTTTGALDEFARFEEVYGGAFGDRLVTVRGNHDAKPGATFGAVPVQDVELPGVHLAVLDTSVEDEAGGALSTEQMAWLDDLAATSAEPVLVLGHHHVWSPDSNERPAAYFGVNPDDSERLVEVVARRPSIVGYLAGHTHRNRVRTIRATGSVPWVEVSCVKDYPGAWAEYRVYEGGIVQILHRISTPEALAWTEQTRHMFAGTYHDYAFGDLADRCLVFPTRR
jgi:predicted phosphodiesterase